jgi:NADPH-dependent ferric siderophore reductase
MPSSPTIMGNLIETALGRPVHVLDSIESAPGFLTLVLTVPAPRGGWQPAHEIQFRVTPRDGRRYTVQAVDERDTDRITLLIGPDTGGPGSAWTRRLELDQQKTALVAPYAPIRQHGTRRLYLGDSSALGTIAALARNVDMPVAIEIPAASAPSLRSQWPEFRFVPAGKTPGDALQRWLEQSLDAGELADIDGAVLLGHAQSLQRQRNALLAHQAVGRKHITTKPYWANGKRGL